jgi:hypothetical protein
VLIDIVTGVDYSDFSPEAMEIVNAQRLWRRRMISVAVLGHRDKMFRAIFKLQIAFVSFLIQVAFLLFSRLVVLLFNDQK